MKKRVLVLVLIVLSAFISYGYATFQYRKERDAMQDNMQSAVKSLQAARMELNAAQRDLEHFKTWNSFVQIQTQLSLAEDQIANLNFGKAIETLDGIQNRIQQGSQGVPFDEKRHELVGYLEKSKAALRRKDEQAARSGLSEFNKRALQIFAGMSPFSGPVEELPAEDSKEAPREIPAPQEEPQTQTGESV